MKNVRNKRTRAVRRIVSVLLVFMMTLGLVSFPAEAAAMKIPKDAVLYNGHCYKVYNKSMTWKKAKKYCEKLGGHLVTVTSRAERNFINKQLKNARSNCYWIGLKYDTKAGNWSWVTGEKFKYTNWNKNEPNNYQNNTEIYVHLFGVQWSGGSSMKYVGEWNDVSNSGASYANAFYDLSNFGFICEWEPSAPKKPQITNVTKKTGLIKGKTTKNVTVYIKMENATYKGTSNSKGVFSIRTRKIKSGTVIKVYAQNQYKLKSKTLTMSVY